MPTDILSNLNALRAFEVSARRCSFTQAAIELNVSQSAISKHISNLEAALGRALFVRHYRQISLTEAGHELAAATTEAFSLIQHAARSVPDIEPGQVNVYCDADFAQLWLFPRLPDFESRNPAVRVRIRSEIGLNHPPKEAFDCAIVWGRGDWYGHRYTPLMTNSVFPVAAPNFFEAIARPATLNDVRSDMLIHDRSSHWWSAFQNLVDRPSFDPRKGRVYDQTVLCLEAAARGDGVTVGDEVTTRPYLESGRLTIPVNVKLPTPDSYYLFLPASRALPATAIGFIEWLKAQTENHKGWWQRFWETGKDTPCDPRTL